MRRYPISGSGFPKHFSDRSAGASAACKKLGEVGEVGLRGADRQIAAGPFGAESHGRAAAKMSGNAGMKTLGHTS